MRPGNICGSTVLAEAVEGSRLQSTQKGLVSLEAAAFEAAFVSQDCSPGWCYKVREQYGKAKEQNSVLIFVFLETWSMVLSEDHMLLSAGAVPNLGVVKRHLSAGAHPPPKHTLKQSNVENTAVIKPVQIKTRSEPSPSGLERVLCKYADQKHV